MPHDIQAWHFFRVPKFLDSHRPFCPLSSSHTYLPRLSSRTYYLPIFLLSPSSRHYTSQCRKSEAIPSSVSFLPLATPLTWKISDKLSPKRSCTEHIHPCINLHKPMYSSYLFFQNWTSHWSGACGTYMMLHWEREDSSAQSDMNW